jgi:hypothetical protein
VHGNVLPTGISSPQLNFIEEGYTILFEVGKNFPE